MSEKERADLTAERQRMNDEMENLSKQREGLEKERAEFIEDRKRLNEEKSQLQLKINEAEKVGVSRNCVCCGCETYRFHTVITDVQMVSRFATAILANCSYISNIILCPDIVKL